MNTREQRTPANYSVPTDVTPWGASTSNGTQTTVICAQHNTEQLQTGTFNQSVHNMIWWIRAVFICCKHYEDLNTQAAQTQDSLLVCACVLMFCTAGQINDSLIQLFLRTQRLDEHRSTRASSHQSAVCKSLHEFSSDQTLSEEQQIPIIWWIT